MSGVHQKGPIVSEQGFKIGNKKSNISFTDSAGGAYEYGSKYTPTKSVTVEFNSVRAAGVLTGDVLLPAGALIENIIVTNVEACNAGTSAVLEVGDLTAAATPVAIDEDGFFDDIDVKTALAAGQSVDFYRTAAKQGVYLPMTTDPQNAASKILGRYTAAARIIRGKLTIVGNTATEGKQLMTVVYSVPEAKGAAFVAAG